MKKIRALLVPLAIVGVILVSYGYWYMIKCEGSWEGEALEVSMTERLSEMEEAIRSDISFLSETLGPRNVAHYESLHRAERWIAARWESQGYEVKTRPYQVEGKWCTNLEIELTGKAKPEEIIILSAQYDTSPYAPGANNNASGVAVLLQVSELLKSHKPDRTVRLINFVNQQSPWSHTEFMGSLRYAKRSRELGESIIVMLSMDSMGIYKHAPGTQKIPFPFSLFYPDKGDFLAFIADLPSRNQVTAVTRGFKRGSRFPIHAASVPQWVEGASWSDHGSFWEYGYPAIQITDTGKFRSATHTTIHDTIDLIDFPALARISVGMYGALLELSTRDET